MTAADIPAVNRLLKKEFRAHSAPIIELIQAQTHDPFCVLVGTILSARTKDACTAGAVRRLFGEMGGTATPEALEGISVARLENLIYPVGFYRDKACELPGVGRKTANLTVAVGFDLPAICVDVHVHRITNRLGLIKTKTPFDTEMALRGILPVRYWKTWNSHLVSFGQTRCFPRNPNCADCPIRPYCPTAKKAAQPV